MSTVAIYNGFGQYEMKANGEKGITLKHGGVEFWFPYEKVTYLPDFTMREVDHRESASDGDEESFLVYKTFRISGNRLAEEMLKTQVPYPNADKGLVQLSNPKRKDSYILVPAGFDDAGTVIMTEVQEVEAGEFDIAESKRLAKEYKEMIIQTYFQAKRERLAGGQGPIFPTGLIKVFMKEMGVKDIDDVTRQLETAAATPGMTNEQLLFLIQSIIGANKPDPVAEVPKNSAPEAKPVQVQKEDLKSLV